MFQPLLDLIERFINVMERIADALELSAKNTYYKEDISIKEKEARELKKKEEEAKRKQVLDELMILKIPYAPEMSTEQLEKRLNDHRDAAIEKIKAAEKALETPAKPEEPKKAKAPAKPKAEPKVPAAPVAPVVEEVKEEPKTEEAGVDDESLRAFCVSVCQRKGDPWLVNFFSDYAKKNKMAYTRISQLIGSERTAFMNAASDACK
jgi:outer membrane biosynthesis protein TonB